MKVENGNKMKWHKKGNLSSRHRASANTESLLKVRQMSLTQFCRYNYSQNGREIDLITSKISCFNTTSMSQAFGENVAPTAAISAILGSYPFSIGLLRELLQNSDDAGATKQVCSHALAAPDYAEPRACRFLCLTVAHMDPPSSITHIWPKRKDRLSLHITMS